MLWLYGCDCCGVVIVRRLPMCIRWKNRLLTSLIRPLLPRITSPSTSTGCCKYMYRPTLQHFNTSTLQHFHFNTLTSTLSLQHSHFNTFASTQSLQYSHFNTHTSTLLLQHYHFNTLTSTLSLQLSHFNSLTAGHRCCLWWCRGSGQGAFRSCQDFVHSIRAGTIARGTEVLRLCRTC